MKDKPIIYKEIVLPDDECRRLNKVLFNQTNIIVFSELVEKALQEVEK